MINQNITEPIDEKKENQRVLKSFILSSVFPTIISLNLTIFLIDKYCTIKFLAPLFKTTKILNLIFVAAAMASGGLFLILFLGVTIMYIVKMFKYSSAKKSTLTKNTKRIMRYYSIYISLSLLLIPLAVYFLSRH